MYSEFLQTNRDYLLHLQNLTILLLTANAYLFYKLRSKKSITGCLLISIFIINVINIMIGLEAYSEQLSTILALRVDSADLMSINPYIYWKFGVNVLTLVGLLYIAIKEKWEN
jgi:hypothetical protein